MTRIALALFAALYAAPSVAQTTAVFPQTRPANSVVGRFGGTVAGPAQAIPFANLLARLVFDSFKQPNSYPVNVTSGRAVCTADSDCQFGNQWSQYPLGLVSTNPIMIGKAGSSIGSSTVGQIFKIVFTSGGLAGSPITASYTAIGGDTTSTIATKLCAVVNANTTLHSATGGKPIFCQAAGASFNLQYDAALGVGGVTPMTTATTGSTGTINLAAEQTPLDYIITQFGRNVPARPAQTGDGINAFDFTANDSTGVFNTHYAQIAVAVAVPTAGATRGVMNFLTAGNSGGPIGRFAIQQGVFMYDSAGTAAVGTDVGPGTINLPTTGTGTPGYYLGGNAVAVNGALYAGPNGGNVFGGTGTGSILNLQSTQNGSPSGDYVQIAAGNKVGYKFDGTTSTLGVPGSVLGKLGFSGSTSGTATITPQTTAGSPTLTLPNASGTFAVTASAPLSLSATTGNLTCPTCVLISGTSHGDSAYSILSTDRYVYTNAAFTAARTWTLPAANSLTAGTTIWVQDAQGTVTTTNTLTIQRAGADTVNVTGTNIVMTGAGGGTQFTTDGVSNWGTAVQTVTTGGTGRQTLTNHGVIIGAGTNPVTQLAVAANGTLLLGATGADPAFAAMSQDCTITASGVITCTKTNNVAFTAGATAAAGQLPGTATNDNASAGNVGEFISSTILVGSAVSLTNGTPANITSISLTAGDWDVAGNIVFHPAGTTTWNAADAWTSTTTAAFPTAPNAGALTQIQGPLTTGLDQALTVGTQRLSLSGTTTVFLSALAGFGTSTMQGYGYIRARRVR